MNFAKASIITFGSKILMFCISLAVGVLIARALGPAGRGQYALYITLTLLGMVLSKSGVEVAGMYYISNQKDDIREISGTCLSTGIILSIFISAILYAYLKLTNTTLFPGFMEFGIYCTVIAIPCMLLRIYARLLLMGRRYVIRFNLLNWFNQIFMLVGAIIVLYIGATVNKMIFVHVTALLLNALAAMILLERADMLTLHFKWRVFKKLIRYGFPTAVGNTCKNLVLKVDILILGYFVSDASIGFYSIAVGLSEKLFLLPESLQGLIIHWVASEKDKHSFIKKVYRNIFYILLAGSVVLVLLSGKLIHLLYPGFEPAIPVTYILIPATLMFSLYTIMSGYILGSAGTKQHMFFNVSALSMNILLNIILIPQMGITGAALATLTSYFFLNFAAVSYFSYMSSVPFYRLFIPRREDLYGFPFHMKKHFLSKGS